MSTSIATASRQRRVVLFWLFVAACVLGTAVYVQMRARVGVAGTATHLLDAASPSVASAIDRLREAPHLLFRSSRTDAFGRIAIARLEALTDPQVFATAECERIHFGRDVGLCLTINRETMTPRGHALILDRHFQEVARLPLAGLPIRARVSPDQRYAVATVFVTGESYASDFTTRTTLIDLTARRAIADLEQFAVERERQPFKAVDFNFWGVTFFQDGNRFFATLGTGGRRLLVEGDVAQRHLRVVGSDVECPSLSPDERHLVFKRQKSKGTGWQLWTMELQTRREWPITEEELDVDDQVEWLDNSHVIYGLLFGYGLPEAALSLWISDISPESGFDQRLFVRSASSPSVIR
jgi:hypothetical protein